MKRLFALSIVGITFVGASCGAAKPDKPDKPTTTEAPSAVDRLESMVLYTCMELRTARSQNEAAQILQFLVVGAASLGFSAPQVGRVLSGACQEAVNFAGQLP